MPLLHKRLQIINFGKVGLPGRTSTLALELVQQSLVVNGHLGFKGFRCCSPEFTENQLICTTTARRIKRNVLRLVSKRNILNDLELLSGSALLNRGGRKVINLNQGGLDLSREW